jgi:hypothetical protein
MKGPNRLVNQVYPDGTSGEAFIGEALVASR